MNTASPVFAVFSLWTLLLSVSANSNDIVVVSGGSQTGTKVDVFPKTGDCSPFSSRHTIDIGLQRNTHSSHYIDGQILICGGGRSSLTKTSCIQLLDQKPLDRSEYGQHRWGTNVSFHSQLNEERSWHSGVILNGKLTIMGGWTSPTTMETLTGKTWTPGRKMLPGDMVGSCVVAIDQSKALVMGGRYSFGAVRVYDADTDSWSSRASMPKERWGHGCAVLGDGRVLVAGGQTSYDKGAETFDTAMVYDGAADRWDEVGKLTGRREFGQIVKLDGRILYLGGETQHNSHLNTVEEFDEGTSTWSLLPEKMKHYMSMLSAVVVPKSALGC